MRFCVYFGLTGCWRHRGRAEARAEDALVDQQEQVALALHGGTGAHGAADRQQVRTSAAATPLVARMAGLR